MIHYDFSTYTLTPFARNAQHDPERNGEDFKKKFLDNWIDNNTEVELYIPELEYSFSDSFVDASFCALIRQHGEQKVFKLIHISDTDEGRDLKRVIREVLSTKRT